MNAEEYRAAIPRNYDRYLGPAIFAPQAVELAARLPVRPAMRVLELACGTGVLTRRLCQRLSSDAHLVATDLSESMLAYARQSIARESPDSAVAPDLSVNAQPGDTYRPAVEFRVADLSSLPFEDGAFDVAVCQFGLMFAPDRAVAVREAWRVLMPGGLYLFNVWDTAERNPIVPVVQEVVSRTVPSLPANLFDLPYSCWDRDWLRGLLAEAGFEAIRIMPVTTAAEFPTATDAAIAYVEGNPTVIAVQEAGADVGGLERAIEEAVVKHFGDRPVRSTTAALIVEARRPC